MTRQVAPVQAAVHRGTAAAFESMTTALLNAWTRRRTLRVLADLEDHVLVDIGLEPASFRKPAEPPDWAVAERMRMAGPIFIGR